MKFLDKDHPWQKEFKPYIASSLLQLQVTTDLPMTFSTFVLATTVIFGGRRGASASQPKDEEALEKWLYRFADTLNSLAGKTAEALTPIVRKFCWHCFKIFK